MTTVQKVIKFMAMAFAVLLTVSIISGILGAIGSIFGIPDGDAVTEDVKTYPVSKEIKSLDISIRAASLTIKRGEDFLVESNLKHLSVEEKNGVLLIKETKRRGSASPDAILTLYVPEEATLEGAKLESGAGALSIEALSAEEIDFTLGAGEVKIDALFATKSADIEGGAGKITIFDGAIHNLDVEMGVGKFNLTSSLSGECNLEAGVGEMNVTLIGDRDDYSLEFEKGIGSITLDGVSVSNGERIGNGKAEVEISGGIGAIHIGFQKGE
ncbi:MAG: DUF4097 family beta strand repeat protein [Clostridia bacterium]|nr:DUF4097 family beta strand repeat protein [Clostridia bacterium]